MHIHIFSEGGSAKVTLRGVDIDNGLTAGSLNFQSYGATQQKLIDLKCFDINNNPVPIKVYGAIL